MHVALAYCFSLDIDIAMITVTNIDTSDTAMITAMRPALISPGPGA